MSEKQGTHKTTRIQYTVQEGVRGCAEEHKIPAFVLFLSLGERETLFNSYVYLHLLLPCFTSFTSFIPFFPLLILRLFTF
jgi:hypothetical protein